METDLTKDTYIGKLEMSETARSPNFLHVYHRDTPKNIVFDLFNHQVPWVPEAHNYHPTVLYKGVDDERIHGWYDTTPFGTPAYEMDGNRVRLTLLERMTQKVGKIMVFVKFMNDSLSYMTYPLCFLEVLESAHAPDPKPRRVITIKLQGPNEIPMTGGTGIFEGLNLTARMIDPETGKPVNKVTFPAPPAGSR